MAPQEMLIKTNASHITLVVVIVFSFSIKSRIHKIRRIKLIIVIQIIKIIRRQRNICFNRIQIRIQPAEPVEIRPHPVGALSVDRRVAFVAKRIRVRRTEACLRESKLEVFDHPALFYHLPQRDTRTKGPSEEISHYFTKEISHYFTEENLAIEDQIPCSREYQVVCNHQRFPLARLWVLQSIWQLLMSVAPPFDQAAT